jgi:PTS system nitrogen regulatory IIA component
MKIGSFLSQRSVMLDVKTSDKAELLENLCKQAAREVALDPRVVSSEILKREQLGSTGVGAGVAIPHARISGLNEPFGILARLKKPMDFAAIDGQPVDLVFLLLLPGPPGSAQLHALATVARQLRKPAVAQALRGARDNVEAHSTILGE